MIVLDDQYFNIRELEWEIKRVECLLVANDFLVIN